MNELFGKFSPSGDLEYSHAQMDDIGLRLKGKRILIRIERFSGKKTQAQLGYYFAGVVSEAAKYFGWEAKDMHDHLRTECNKREVVDSNSGEITWVVGSTADLSKFEYMEFIERCRIYLAEKGFEVRSSADYFRQLEEKFNQSQSEEKGK